MLLFTTSIFLTLIFFQSVEKSWAISNSTRDKAIKSNARGRLISDLFLDYDKTNYPSNSTIELGLTVFSFDINVNLKTLEVDAWLLMSWHDPRLQWNPNDYGQEKKLTYPSNKVFIPDIALYNSANSLHNFPCRDTNVVIESEGKLTWVNPCHFEVRCTQLKLDRFPLGEHNCSLEFGSWTMDGHLLDIQLEAGRQTLDLNNFHDNGDWKLLDTRAWRQVKTFSCCPEPYVSVKFQLTFQQKDNDDQNSG